MTEEFRIELANGWTLKGRESVTQTRKVKRIAITDGEGRVIGHSLEWEESAPTPPPTPQDS